MSSRSVIHNSKKEAILQLCNLICPVSILQVEELANGEILLKTIEAKFHTKSVNSENFDKVIHVKEEPCEVDDVNTDLMKINQSNVKEKECEVEESLVPPSPIENPAKNEAIFRFNYIQEFIDDRYQIKSCDIIDYTKLTESCDELLKLALFVLAEIVKHMLQMNNELLQTLFHLDAKFQVELEECFKLFISERDKLSKTTVEKLLSKKSKNASPYVTPRRTSSRHKEWKSVSPPTTKDDIFSNSPLKAYFESPVFKKEDIFMKDKQIENLKKTLDEGDEETLKLHSMLSEKERELKMKDKINKQLKKQLTEKMHENDFLRNSCQSESCKVEKERLSAEINTSKDSVLFYRDRVAELNGEIADLHKIIQEKDLRNSLEFQKKENKSNESNDQVIPVEIITTLQYEKEVFKARIKSLELKLSAYKKQLSEKILTEVKEKKPPGNLNTSYEERWEELYRERKMDEENMAYLIEEDNRILFTKYNEVNLEIKKLREENEVLKKQKTIKNKKLNQKNEVCSVATMTVLELNDTSKTPEIERLRNSLNYSENIEHCQDVGESSYILNSSDNFIVCEQSKVSSESGLFPCSEKSSKLDSIVLENSHLDLINDLRVNNYKIDNAEADILLNQENKYVLGNLNFNAFLNELKKLTKNGSFQKVLQVFGKCQKEINGTKKSNRLDLQELLKIITKCVCVAVALNAESSFANLQDKCCSTDVSDFYCLNQNTELDNLKDELRSTTQKHEIELKECRKELEDIKQERNFLELKYQAYDQKISEKSKSFKDLLRKYNEVRINYDELFKKFRLLKEIHKKHSDLKRKQETDFLQLKNVSQYLKKKSNAYNNTIEKLKEENTLLKEAMKLKEKEISQVNASEENDRKSDLPAPSRDSCVGIPDHFNVLPELYPSSAQDNSNDAAAGAFHKSHSHYVSADEDDIFYHSSLDNIKHEYDKTRIDEIRRRNSLLPIHLQSAYPLESDLNTSYQQLYVKNSEKSMEEIGCKKRKLDDPISEEPSVFTLEIKPKRKVGTPKSLQKFIRNIRSRHTFPIKPKGA